MGFTDWTAPVQRGDTANGAGLAVAPVDAVKAPPSQFERTAQDAVPIVIAAGGGLVMLLLVVHFLRRRRPRRPGESGTGRAGAPLLLSSGDPRALRLAPQRPDRRVGQGHQEEEVPLVGELQERAAGEVGHEGEDSAWAR